MAVNKGLIKYTVAEAQNMQLGQGRTALLDSTNAYTVSLRGEDTAVVAIQIIQDAKFQALTAQFKDFHIGTNQTDGIYTDKGCGDLIANTMVVPAGITLYGRWTTVDLASGVVLLYLGS